MEEKKISGRIHSKESFGAVDGPGVRFVVFLQGCPLKCMYCHNPDTWNLRQGTLVYAKELAEEILSYKKFIQRGGVTLSGGEPLMQAKFCAEVLRRCQKAGLHTAVDTSGCMPLKKTKPVLEYTDLVLLDIKDIVSEDAKKLTGMGNENTLALLDYCEEIKKDVWIRHVLLPGFTMVEKKLADLADYLLDYSCVKKIELLPFHKMGEYKWKAIGYRYELADTPEPSAEQYESVKEFFRLRGFQL